ncbi:MAG: hypothetical protein KAG61_00030, partial [Bacteriovoracaceae bacterium]|nr:hypothetical protein [Bacteriovoracaceae bacterium]
MSRFIISLLAFLLILPAWSMEKATYMDTYDAGRNHIALPQVSTEAVYDNFTGQFSTKLPIKLHSLNPALRKSLDLQYISSDYSNNGYGIGFRLSIPQIIPNPFPVRTDYIFDSGNSRNEIASTPDGFREVELKHFAKFEKRNNKTIMTYPSGKVMEFDLATGHILKEVDTFSNAWIKYKWKEGHLKQVSLYNGLSLNFTYATCKTPADKTWIARRLREQVKNKVLTKSDQCLQSIEYSDKSVLSFSYDDVYLKKVFWKNSEDKPLFIAEYSDEHQIHNVEKRSPIYGVPSDDSVALSLGKEGIRFSSRREILGRFGVVPNSESVSFSDDKIVGTVQAADFNNDGLTDLIVSSMTHTGGSLDDSITHVLNFGEKITATPMWRSERIRVYTGKLNANKDNLDFSISQNFTLPKIFINIHAVCVEYIDLHNWPARKTCSNADWKHKGEYFYNDWTSWQREHSKLLLGDFDNNGTQDILSCGKNKLVAYNNSSGFNIVPHNIDCKVNSISSDVNLDGITDIVSSNGVFLNNGKTHIYTNKYSEYSSIITFLSDQQRVSTIDSLDSWNRLAPVYKRIKDKILVDTDLDGIPDIIEKDELVYHATYGEEKAIVRFKKDSSDFEVIPVKRPKLITKLINWIGGSKHIFYTYKYNNYIVSKVLTSNGREQYTEELEYDRPMFNPLTTNITGYQLLKQTRSGVENVEDSEKYFVFKADINTAELLKRAPIHGLPSAIATCKKGACPKLAKYFKYPVGNAIPLEEAPKISKYYSSIIDASRLPENFGDDQYFIFPSKTKTLKMKKIRSIGETKHLALIEDYIPLDFTTHGPLRTKAVTLEGIKINNALSDDRPNRTMEKVTTSEIINNIVLPVSSTIKYFSGDKVPDQITSFEYMGKPGDSDFKVTTRTKINNTEDRKSLKVHDSSGRVKSTTLATGAKTSFLFKESESTITENKEKVSISRTFSRHGDLLNESTMDKLDHKALKLLIKSYELPGLLKELQFNDFKYQINYKKNKNSMSQNIVLSAGKKIIETSTTEFDGNGKKIFQSTTKDDQTYISYKVKRNALGLPITTYFPQYGTSELERDKTYLYDHLNRPLAIKNNWSGLTNTFSYKNGWTIKSQNGNSVETIDTGAGDVPFGSTLPLRGVLTIDSTADKMIKGIYGFEGASTLKVFRDATGNIREVQNADGRPLLESFSTAFSTTLYGNIQYKFNKEGALSTIVDSLSGTTTYDHDAFSRLSSKQYASGLKETATYNLYDTVTKMTYKFEEKELSTASELDDQQRPTKTTYSSKNNISELKYQYKGDLPRSIMPYISAIEHDKFGNLKTVTYSSGLNVNYQFNPQGALEAFSTPSHSESYERNNDELIVSMTSTLSQTKDPVEKYYRYDKAYQLVESPRGVKPGLAPQRSTILNLENDNELFYDTNKRAHDIPVNSGVKEYDIMFEGLTNVVGLNNFDDHTIQFLSNNIHFTNNKWVKYIYVSAVLVGAIVIGENETIFYPIVTDTRGSVRLVYNNSGHLAMMKNYTTWGEIDLGKSEVIEKGIDRLIILDFANLKRPSIKFPYLFSNSRVYVPSIGEWTTIDPLLLQSPEVFAFDRVKESDGISYAGNDPVNFVDPSGY